MPTFTPDSLLSAITPAGYVRGERIELSAIAPGGSISSLWITIDDRGLERGASWLARRALHRNLYLLANPLRPDASRSGAGRALDDHVACARLLLIDVDPVKVRQRDLDRGHPGPLDVLGTAPHKLEAAVEVADLVRAWITEHLGVTPPLIDSGRGRQLWLRFAGDGPDRSLRRRLVHLLALRFDREDVVTVDRSTHNAARLMRLPGSTNHRTGRTAQVLDLGDGRLASAGQLAEVLDELAPGTRPATATSSPRTFAPLAPGEELARLQSALEVVPSDDRETWIRIGIALWRSGLPDAYALWDSWSSTAGSYRGPDDTAKNWASFRPDSSRQVTIGTVYHLAQEHGWKPPPRPERDDGLLELANVYAPARELTDDPQALVHTAVQPQKKERPVIHDRRPTGAGKTTLAAQELFDGSPRRYLWAAPTHDLARLEALPALARAGFAVWDEDLDEDAVKAIGAVRGRILPLGEREDGGPPVAAKVPPFDCPGPDGRLGWTADEVNKRYQEVAARGWNPAATVCRACAKFTGEDGERCSYWERRALAAKADVYVVPHHGLQGDNAAKGRAALVIDEDPSSALVRRQGATRRQIRAFRVLLERAIEDLAAHHEDRVTAALEAWRAAAARDDEDEIEQARQKLERASSRRDEQITAAHATQDAAAIVLELVDELITTNEGEISQGNKVPEVIPVQLPDGVSPAALRDAAQLRRACERVMRELGRKKMKLRDEQANEVGAVKNLFPFLAQAGVRWAAAREAILHVRVHKNRGISLVMPLVHPLPDLPVLALDATGDTRLLELSTKREVWVIEGELSVELEGVHLADFPCGRRRWKKEKFLQEDAEVMARYARRVGAKRIGLVTFKATEGPIAKELQKRAAAEVKTLYYGKERGSNAFVGWADLVIVAGTPFVHPRELRLRADIEGATAEELLTPPTWAYRRLPGGGTAKVLELPGEAMRRAWRGLVHSSLEQALGRAGRGDWAPSQGVLVMASPWPTRHRLRITTRLREVLSGAEWDALEILAPWIPGLKEAIRTSSEPRELVVGAIRKIISDLGGSEKVAEMIGIPSRSIRRWGTGERLPAMTAPDHPLFGLLVSRSRMGWSSTVKDHPPSDLKMKGPGPTVDDRFLEGPGPPADDHFPPASRGGGSSRTKEIGKAPAEVRSGADDHLMLVRAAIAKAGSQRALARLLSCGHSSITYWKSGKQQPQEDYVAKMKRVVQGSKIEGVGMVYAEASVPEGMPVEPPPSPVVALKAWASITDHPCWFLRAVRRAKGKGSLATWLGTRKRDGQVGVDDDLALSRVRELEALDPPIEVRAALEQVAQLLVRRGACEQPIDDEPLVQAAQAELGGRRARRSG